jgi:hypothetical protein
MDEGQVIFQNIFFTRFSENSSSRQVVEHDRVLLLQGSNSAAEKNLLKKEKKGVSGFYK